MLLINIILNIYACAHFTTKTGFIIQLIDIYDKKTVFLFFPGRFQVKNPNDNDYVSIKNNVGCHAELGRIGGEQTLNIGEGPCIKRGTVMHELMHVLGFMHEQKRYDRDSFIRIMYENLKEGKLYEIY